MGSFFQRKPVRVFLSWFRWCRISVLLAIFLVVAAVAYLHLVGLPDYLKRPLLRHLREKGFAAEFSNMHLGWGPSVIIDNGAFRRADDPAGPRLSASRVELAVNLRAMLHSRLEVNSFSVRDGRLELPLSITNGDILLLDNVQLNVALLSNNVAQLREAVASFRGIQISVHGEISDFQSLRDWRFPFRLGRYPPGSGKEHLRQIAETIRAIRLEGAPRLTLEFVADGRDLNTLQANMEFTAQATTTPWGSARNLDLRVACARLLQSGASPFVQVRLGAGRVTTPWGGGRNLALEADLSKDAVSNYYAAVNFAGREVDAKWQSRSGSNCWVRALDGRWNGAATLVSSNFAPVSFGGTLRLTNAASTWGSSDSLQLTARVQRDQGTLAPNPEWGPWGEAALYSIDWKIAGETVRTPKLQLEDAALEGRWRAPRLTVQKMQAKLYQGHAEGQADLDMNSRELNIQATADFDAHRIAPLMAVAAQHFFADFEWARPPRVVGGLRLVLPPWTNRPENWKETYRDSVALAADFSVGTVSYRGIPVSSGASHFTYTNRVWTVPGLRVKRPDGNLRMDYMGNEATHEYSFKFDSNLDPADVFDWIPEEYRGLAREVKFLQPPEIHAQISGQWHNRAAFAFSGTVAASNLTVRGQTVDFLGARMEYTNRSLRVEDLRLSRNGGALSVPLATADLESTKVFLTNVQSTLDPRLLIPVLRSNTPPFLQHFYFDTPPSVRVDGSFSWTNPQATALNFRVKGQNFHWTNLTSEKISADIQWLGRDVALTNIQARLYKTGSLHGWVTFDYAPKKGSSFRSDITVRDIDLPALARGLTGKTNKLEGLLDGRLTLESQSFTNKGALQGRGHIYVHDALLWDIRIFGIFTPILNVLSPGAGYSRARSASAIFTIDNGTVSTDDLEIEATGFRLLYRGKLTPDKHIDARVEADLLRDAPLLGPFLSFMLTPLSKLFEYRVTGTLQNPNIEPLYIPRGLMMFLRPFHTLKSFLPDSSTDAPGSPAKTQK